MTGDHPPTRASRLPVRVPPERAVHPFGVDPVGRSAQYTRAHGSPLRTEGKSHMRNFLALIGAVVVLFVGLGWYLGWYSFMLSPGAEGKQRLQVDVDTKKIADDAKKVGQAANNVIQSATKDDTKGATPAPMADFVGPPVPDDLPTRQPKTTSPTPLQFPPSMKVPGPLPGPKR